MFFISRERFERAVERRADMFMKDFHRNEEVNRMWQRLEELDRRINRLEHPIPKGYTDAPTTCKCGD